MRPYFKQEAAGSSPALFAKVLPSESFKTD